MLHIRRPTISPELITNPRPVPTLQTIKKAFALLCLSPDLRLSRGAIKAAIGRMPALAVAGTERGWRQRVFRVVTHRAATCPPL
jgi:hypothetical protein